LWKILNSVAFDNAVAAFPKMGTKLDASMSKLMEDQSPPLGTNTAAVMAMLLGGPPAGSANRSRRKASSGPKFRTSNRMFVIPAAM
jgi:hypothetical protein